MIHITFEVEDVVRKVRELAEEAPDFVYTKGPTHIDGIWNGGCKYAPDEQNPKGCIIGAALSALGVDTAGGGFDAFEGLGVTALLRRIHLEPSEHQGRWLERVQGHQDSGNTWGAAVAFADTFGRPEDE